MGNLLGVPVINPLLNSRSIHHFQIFEVVHQIPLIRQVAVIDFIILFKNLIDRNRFPLYNPECPD